MIRCELVVTHASMEALISTVISLKTLTLLRHLTIAVALDGLSWEWIDNITSAALHVPMLTALVWKVRSDGRLDSVKMLSFRRIIGNKYSTDIVAMY